MTVRRGLRREVARAVRLTLATGCVHGARWSRAGGDRLADLLAVTGYALVPADQRAQALRPQVVGRWARDRIWTLAPGMQDEITRRRMGAGS